MPKIITALNEQAPECPDQPGGKKDRSVRLYFSGPYSYLLKPFDPDAIARALKTIREARRRNTDSRRGFGGRESSLESGVLYVVIHYWMQFPPQEVFDKLKDLSLSYCPLKPIQPKPVLVTLPHSFSNWLTALAKISGAQVLEVMAALLAGYVKHNPGSMLLASNVNTSQVSSVKASDQENSGLIKTENSDRTRYYIDTRHGERMVFEI